MLHLKFSLEKIVGSFVNIATTKPKKEKCLTIHIGKLHGAEKEVNDESFKCDMCDNILTSESMLKVHKTSFHSWKCRNCIIMNVNNREKHMREVHKYIDKEQMISHTKRIFIKNDFDNPDLLYNSNPPHPPLK